MSWNKGFAMSRPVSLEEMLDAREMRAALRWKLIAVWKLPLVCFTLNIPGAYKTFPLATDTFEEGKRLISALLHQIGSGIHYVENRGKTGYEAFWGICGDAGAIKTALLALEEGHPLGRLFDIDVFDRMGAPLRRSDFGRCERTCLICGEPVWGCARSRKHSAEELSQRVVQMMAHYFNERFAEEAAQKAVRALMTEVCITPKPGLVDRADNGAHRDMDVFSFINSGCALFSFFRRVTLFCTQYEGAPETLLEAIRFHGVLAENAMFLATGGVNTHKGAIFSLGLLCAAAGYLYGSGAQLETDALFERCSALAKSAASVPMPVKSTTVTHGEAVFAAYGLAGIRGEAVMGFPAVRAHALPVFKELMQLGYPLEQAGVVALLHLIAHTDDTNIVARAGLSALRETQRRVGLVLQREKDVQKLLEYASELNGALIARNISPGGCADLLAATILADSLCNETAHLSFDFAMCGKKVRSN